MAITIRRAHYPVCGAQLRRDRSHGQLGDPSDKVGPSPGVAEVRDRLAVTAA